MKCFFKHFIHHKVFIIFFIIIILYFFKARIVSLLETEIKLQNDFWLIYRCFKKVFWFRKIYLYVYFCLQTLMNGRFDSFGPYCPSWQFFILREDEIWHMDQSTPRVSQCGSFTLAGTPPMTLWSSILVSRGGTRKSL